MDYIDRKATKLLAQSAALASRMIAEALCDVPQKDLVRVMLEELRANLDEFEAAYFHEG
jgi:hypothetical protein